MVRAGMRYKDFLAAVLLVVVAACVRWGALAPSSLAQDDAWQGLVHRLTTWDQLRIAGVTAPGFAWILKGVFSLAGFSELTAQIVPFGVGLIAVVAVFLTGRRIGGSFSAAFTVGLLLAIAPAHALVSTLVKQYTIDGLVATITLLLAAELCKNPMRRSLWFSLVAVAIFGFTISTGSAAAVLPALLVGGWSISRSNQRVAAALGLGMYGLVATLWAALIIRPTITPKLRTDWSEQYVSYDNGVAGVLRSSLGRFLDAFRGLSPVWFVLILLTVLGVASLLRKRELVLASLLLGPLATACILAALRLVPIGGSGYEARVNTYLYPSILLLVMFGMMASPPAIPQWAIPAAVSAVCLLMTPLSTRYPNEDLRPLMAELGTSTEPDDVVLLDPVADWGGALYSPWPVHIQPDDNTTPPYIPSITRSKLLLPSWDKENPAASATDVAAVTKGSRVVWLVGLRESPGFQSMLSAVEDEGFTQTARTERPGAVLIRFERSP